MPTKINSTPIINFNLDAISGGNFWHSIDRPAFIFPAIADRNGNINAGNGYGLNFEGDGSGIFIGGCSRTDLIDTGDNDFLHYWENVTLTEDQGNSLGNFVGYPFSINAYSVFDAQRQGEADHTYAALNVKGWIRSYDNVSRRARVAISDGSISTLHPRFIKAGPQLPLVPIDETGFPNWITAIMATATAISRGISEGNLPVSGTTYRMPVIFNSHIITMPGRNEGAFIQDTVEGNVENGTIPLSVPIPETEPEEYNQSTVGTVLDSFFTPSIYDISDNSVVVNGGHSLTISIPDRHSIGLANINPIITNSLVRPIMIEGNRYFINDVQETETNEIILNLVTSRT